MGNSGPLGSGDDERLGSERIKHLEFIQSVIARLGNSSFLIKGWTLTIAAGFFAVTANRLSWKLSVTALVPIVAFWFLDGFFLRQERLFRCLYDHARLPNSDVELMSMDAWRYKTRVTWFQVTTSFTLLAFYGSLVVIDAIFIVGAVILR